jgi:putative transposase
MATGAFHRSHVRRKGRFSEPGRAYLVTAVTHVRGCLFADWRVGRAVARELAAAQVQTLAWVLMPDHLHWLLVLGDEDLGPVVGALKSRSAQAVNPLLDRAGPVWQEGYHDHGVHVEKGLRALSRYVVANRCGRG